VRRQINVPNPGCEGPIAQPIFRPSLLPGQSIFWSIPAWTSAGACGSRESRSKLGRLPELTLIAQRRQRRLRTPFSFLQIVEERHILNFRGAEA